MDVAVEPGSPTPLGASWDGRGVNFAIFSQHALAAELCLFDAVGNETRVPVGARTRHVWHVYLQGMGPGQRYGWRFDGPYVPEYGQRFNRNKLLVDPYARALDGELDTRGPVYGYPRDRALDDRFFDNRDDAAYKPKSVVVDERYDWGDDHPPRVPWERTVVYEVHVRGFTKRHPDVPEPLRGTYLGLASEPAIEHLRSLGVTTLKVMPVHARANEPFLVVRGLSNYWGYNTLGFFAPDERFASRPGAARDEFRQMVKALHAAGFEVVIDVVYNHTCEGDRLGPTALFRGIDDAVYYRHDAKRPGDYVDTTGTGNTVDVSHPQVLKLVTDSLRFWASEMHVDGFRFDLAPALARDAGGTFDRRSAFVSTVHQDPVLSKLKLIAEPWDVGFDGYRLGDFPVLWTEYNDRFRDTDRHFWRGERKVIGDLGSRLTGSSDIFAVAHRPPQASLNFVTVHDGFTLRDLVTYEARHNEANGEANADGGPEGSSQNMGVEGEIPDPRLAPSLLARRLTVARSLLATVFVSQGVPLLQMGDELWRTQRGNSNGYCQDSEVSWVDWRPGEPGAIMLTAARTLIALRQRLDVFRKHDFLKGLRVEGKGKDITWLRADGVEMQLSDWREPARATLAFRLEGAPAAAVLMNGEASAVAFSPGEPADGSPWTIAFDASDPIGGPSRVGHVLTSPAVVEVGAGSVVVLVSAERPA